MKSSVKEIEFTELLCVGSIGADFVFSGVNQLPEIGKLIIVESMEFHPGGCATNTSLAYAKLGGKVRLIGLIGEDFIGETVLQLLTRSGVITDRIFSETSTTAVTVVLVSLDGERTFIYYPGANFYLSHLNVDSEIFLKTKIVHFADTFLLPELDGTGTNLLLSKAKKNGIVTSIDTSWDIKNRWLGLLGNNLPLVDFFFCNLTEAQAMTGHENEEDASKALLEYGPNMVIIKMGEKGSFIQTNDFSLRIPAYNVEVVDTTGAGDCYVAAFLFGHLQGWDYEKTALFATVTASMCVKFIGATTGICSYTQLLPFILKKEQD